MSDLAEKQRQAWEAWGALAQARDAHRLDSELSEQETLAFNKWRDATNACELAARKMQAKAKEVLPPDHPLRWDPQP
jgi:hypothetical protein